MINFIKFIKERKTHSYKDNVIFNILIKDKKEILSTFVIDDKETINSEFANILDNKAKSISQKSNVTINIKCDNMTLQEEKSCSDAIKNYYNNKIVDSQRRIRNNNRIFIIMVIFSLFSLSLLFLTHWLSLNWLIIEIFDIIAWVFVWESVDIMAFQRVLIKYEKQRNLILCNSKIEFKKNNNNF